MLKEKLSIERKKAVMITADFTAPTTESYGLDVQNIYIDVLCANEAREVRMIWSSRSVISYEAKK